MPSRKGDAEDAKKWYNSKRQPRRYGIVVPTGGQVRSTENQGFAGPLGQQIPVVNDFLLPRRIENDSPSALVAFEKDSVVHSRRVLIQKEQNRGIQVSQG